MREVLKSRVEDVLAYSKR
jgi:chromosome segregation ATPase